MEAIDHPTRTGQRLGRRLGRMMQRTGGGQARREVLTAALDSLSCEITGTQLDLWWGGVYSGYEEITGRQWEGR